MSIFTRFCLLVAAAGFVCGCGVQDQTSGQNTHGFPYSVSLGPAIGGRIVAVADLDEDGTDESLSLRYPNLTAAPDQFNILISRWNGQAVSQLNAVGEFRNARALQLDGSGRLEVLVSLVRDDTLFYVIHDTETGTQTGFPVATGSARIDESGNTLGWRASAVFAAAIEYDGDEQSEILSAVTTGYARYPRGILVHDLETGALLDSIGVGANITDVTPVGEGLHVTSTASENGAGGRGMTDEYSYSFVVQTIPDLQLDAVSQIGDRFTSAHVISSDLDSDGLLDYLLYVRGGDDRKPAGRLLALLDPLSAEFARQISNTTRIEHVAVADLDRDAESEIYVLDDVGDISMYDAELGYTGSIPGVAVNASPRTFLHVYPDVSGDAVSELVVQEGSRFTFLGPDLEPLSVVGAADVPGREIIDLVSMQANYGVESRLYAQSLGTSGGYRYQLMTINPAVAPGAGGLYWWLLATGALFAIAVFLGLHASRLAEMLTDRDGSESRANAILSRDGRLVEADMLYRILMIAVEDWPTIGEDEARERLPEGEHHIDIAERRIPIRIEHMRLPAHPSHPGGLLIVIGLQIDADRLVRLLARAGRESGDETVQAYILGRMIDNSDDPRYSSDILDFVTMCSTILHRHGLDSTFSVEQFASTLGLSTRQLQRRLSELTGRTPGEVIARYRLSVACRLLRKGEMQIKEIAHEIGFSSPESFSRRFRQEFGVPPTEYAS